MKLGRFEGRKLTFSQNKGRQTPKGTVHTPRIKDKRAEWFDLLNTTLNDSCCITDEVSINDNKSINMA